MKILILSSNFGSGHYSAAQAIKEECLNKGHRVYIYDVVEVLYPKEAKYIYEVFRKVICKNSQIYNLLNNIGRKQYQNPKKSKKLHKLIREINPDLIISTWSGCGRKLGRIEIPVHIYITDVTVHEGWLYPDASIYWVANNDVANALLKLNVAPEKIRIYGIPVKEEFRKLQDKLTMCQNKHLLIMGGGLGIIPWLDELLIGLKDIEGLKITVITGKNKELYKKVKRNFDNVEVLAYTNEMPKYIWEADYVISKPGGVSLFESIYATTPYIAMYPVYKQEIANAEYINKHQIGTVIYQNQDAVKAIIELLNDDKCSQLYQDKIVALKHQIILERHKNQEVI